ncbi:dihydroorotase [Microbacterium sp. EYE_5]|uniref:dihydroorotase n=1 Tax=unclassified Microbacterium TaxID=2609290 RepID=UPI0020043936|nr:MULTISPECIES: dihydroorotase [unclassified Microbacterium]MCK6080733.1 dihydroorotase [Microbacterium sp. EYE_382]MCK6086004.1 dihydroorotase [Microbacterium sp. EYE_384]MCK6124498.1 dihydroorotase [Microbacterium sp. EYE_80]MCK6127407.1 dihydroorotase [Microbacterium sp. EYE_79]MCK6141688.1 dihydroorotase [Microbacterium sp. EYE_39]
MSEAILIRGARIQGGEAADILIEDGVIAALGSDASRAGARVVDAAGLIALPGLVDLHTHLREPGYEASETILTGSRAAAAGGYATVFAMPNTSPVADTAGVVEQELALGEAAGYVHVQPIGAVTVGQKGERLAELGAMAASRARVRVFSDDGFCVFDPLIMRRALEYVKSFGGVVAQHAQDPRLTEGAQMNEGTVSAELGLTGWPAVAEESIIARDVLLAEHVGSRLHVCHLSTAGSVDLIRWAKKRGIAVTAEVTPHHLLLTEELVRGYDPRFKVNPPLRRDEDVRAVREGLADGTIDIVATDHAPHPAEAKNCEWQAAANGMVGLESALRVVHAAMVDTGLLDWDDVARVMSSAPARIGGLDAAGAPLAVGAPASLALYDPAPARAFSTADLRGRSVNSPYLGRELPGEVRHTFYRGRATVVDGAVVDEVAS